MSSEGERESAQRTAGPGERQREAEREREREREREWPQALMDFSARQRLRPQAVEESSEPGLPKAARGLEQSRWRGLHPEPAVDGRRTQTTSVGEVRPLLAAGALLSLSLTLGFARIARERHSSHNRVTPFTALAYCNLD